MENVGSLDEVPFLSLGDEGCDISDIVQTMLPRELYPIFHQDWQIFANELRTGGDVLATIPPSGPRFDPAEVLRKLLENWLMVETRQKATIERLIEILKKTRFRESARRLNAKYFPERLSIRVPSSTISVERSPTSTRKAKCLISISSSISLVVVIALIVCSSIYSKDNMVDASSKFLAGDEVVVETSDLQHLEDYFLKSKNNVSVKLIIKANSSMANAPRLKYAHIIKDIVVQGETFSAGLKSLLEQTKYLRSINIELPYPHWNSIFPASEKFTDLRAIAISTPKRRKNFPCPLISLGDDFCENFGSIQVLNITYGCISFESRYQVLDCKTLKQLSIQILYTRNQYLDLGLVNRLHRIEEVDLYLYFDTACPMGDETIRLSQEISRFVNEGNLRCINIWSNCSLNSDFDVFSRQICTQR